MGIIMDVGKGRGEIIMSLLNLFYFLPPGLFPKRPPLPPSPLPGGKLRTSKLSENEPTDWGEQRFEWAPSALMKLSKKNPRKSILCILCPVPRVLCPPGHGDPGFLGGGRGSGEGMGAKGGTLELGPSSSH